MSQVERHQLSSPDRLPSECGVIMITVVFLVLVMGGFASAMLIEVRAEKQSVDRHETSFEALHAAELGLAKAELELLALVDAETDGIGTVTGSVLAASFETAVFGATSAPSALSDDRWTVTARGEKGHSVRRVEIGVRRRAGGAFMEGMYARDQLTINGDVTTDSFDSRAGTYASQAVNTDSEGNYAGTKGHVGSENIVLLDGSAVYIRGNAIPGYGYELQTTGTPTILGDTLPRTAPLDLPDPTPAEFTAALNSTDNLVVETQATGNGQITYSDPTRSVSVKSTETLTLSAGTYFFRDFSLIGAAKLEITGDVKIYITGNLNLGGGGVINSGGSSSALSIIAHPYALPAARPPISSSISISGGSSFIGTVYGPEVNLSLSGSVEYFGAVVGKGIETVGAVNFHYDEALGDLGGRRKVLLERLYWRDLAPPRR